MLTLLCTLLTNLLHFLYFVFSLEVSLFDLLDSILVLLFKILKFIHAHIHDILFSPRISNHHAKVWWELVKVDVAIFTAVGAVHRPIELLLASS